MRVLVLLAGVGISLVGAQGLKSSIIYSANPTLSTQTGGTPTTSASSINTTSTASSIISYLNSVHDASVTSSTSDSSSGTSTGTETGASTSPTSTKPSSSTSSSVSLTSTSTSSLSSQSTSQSSTSPSSSNPSSSLSTTSTSSSITLTSPFSTKSSSSFSVSTSKPSVTTFKSSTSSPLSKNSSTAPSKTSSSTSSTKSSSKSSSSTPSKTSSHTSVKSPTPNDGSDVYYDDAWFRNTTMRATTQVTLTETKFMTSAIKKLVRAVTTSSSTTSAPCTNTSPANILHGYQPTPNNDPYQFLIDTTLGNQASANILPPAGYTTSFTGYLGEVSSSGYLGYHQLPSYNTSLCSAFCDAYPACNAFDIYFERNGLYTPDNTCRNPAGAAVVDCTLWANYINSNLTTNIGQYQDDFCVVVAGSNGYNQNIPPSSVPNYKGPNQLKAAINVQSGAQFISAGAQATYDPTFCSNLCNTYTANARANATKAKLPTYIPCNYFNTFNYSINGQYQGMYCQLYTTSAVNYGYDTLYNATINNQFYTLTYSYGYALYPQDPGFTNRTWVPAPTEAAASCAGLGSVGTVITDYDQVNYTLACGYDLLYQLDIANATAPDFYSCMILCDAIPACSGYAYLGTQCYFKNITGSGRTPQLDNYNVDLAWQPNKYAGFNASTVSQTITYLYQTTAWTGKSTTTTTVFNGLTATILIETPGLTVTTSTPTSTIYTDSGTATSIITSTGGDSKVTVVYPTPSTKDGTTIYGVRFAMYTNSFAGLQGTTAYPAYTPEIYKTITPAAKSTGIASYIGEYNDATTTTVSIYKLGNVKADTLVLDHTFYLFASRGTGYYYFELPYNDDIALLWVGAKALSGWTRANADLTEVWYGGITNPGVTITYYLTFGTYTPVRLQWANGGAAGALQFNIYAPDGSIIAATTPGANAGILSPYIVQYPINAANGAPFPAWGKET